MASQLRHLAGPGIVRVGAGAVGVGAGAVGVSVVCVLPMFLTAGLAVQIGADLGFSASALGAAPAAFFGAMVLVSPFSGRMVDRLGTLRAIRVVTLVVAVLLAAVAGLAHSYPVLIALLALAGATNALAQPATNQLLAVRVPRPRQGLAYGAKYSAIPIASMLAGLAVPTIALTAGWRWAYVIFAVVALLVVLWPFGDVSLRRPDRDDANEVRLPRHVLLVLATGVGLAAASGSSLAIFMVASAVDTGWSEGGAGLLFAAASSVGVATRILAGLRADRRGRNHLRVVAVMLVAGALGVAAMAAGTPASFALGAPLAFGAGWGWPGLFVLAVVSLNRGAPAAATGLTQTGTSAGCVAGPIAFGLLVGHASYPVAWSANAAVLLLGAAVVLLGRQQVRHHVPAPQGSVYGPPPTPGRRRTPRRTQHPIRTETP